MIENYKAEIISLKSIIFDNYLKNKIGELALSR